MTGVDDDGAPHDLHAQSVKAEAHGTGPSALDALHEENQVLQFLLGKTLSLRSDDTSSVTSTSSSSHSHSHSQSPSDASEIDWSGQSQDMCGHGAGGVADGPSPELEPICESASEDDTTGGGSSPRKPSLRVSVFHSSGLYRGIARWLQGLAMRPVSVEASPSPPETETMKLSSVCPPKPTIEAEGGDTIRMAKSGEIRQGRRSPSVNMMKATSIARLDGKPEEVTARKKRFHAIHAHSDMIFVTTVLIVLFGYCVAIGYRFFYPVVFPLPNVDALFKPWDVSNVTARLISPSPDSQFTGAVPIAWEIANFPTDAIREGGVEPFEYQLLLDGHRIQFEVGYWSIPDNYNESILNKTITHRLRPRDIPNVGQHELRLEVTFPIPGSDGELRTLTDTTVFTVVKPKSSEPSLQIKRPNDGAVVETPVVLLEFEAQNVHEVKVILDGKSRLHMVNWRDGNLLLRGIGVGSHTITVEAVNHLGALVATQSTRIQVRERTDPQQLGTEL